MAVYNIVNGGNAIDIKTTPTFENGFSAGTDSDDADAILVNVMQTQNLGSVNIKDDSGTNVGTCSIRLYRIHRMVWVYMLNLTATLTEDTQYIATNSSIIPDGFKCDVGTSGCAVQLHDTVGDNFFVCNPSIRTDDSLRLQTNLENTGGTNFPSGAALQFSNNTDALCWCYNISF